MDSAGLSDRLTSFQQTIICLIKKLEKSFQFSEDDDIELKHFVNTVQRGLRNIKDVVEGAMGPLEEVPVETAKAPKRVGTTKEDVKPIIIEPGVTAKSKVKAPTPPPAIVLDTDSDSNDTIEFKEEPPEEVPDDQEETHAVKLEDFEDNFDDVDFEEDDFDESMMKEIDEAEQSFNAADAEPVLDITAEEEDVEHQPDDPKYLEVLKQYFGYGKFRPLQWKIINSLLNERRDNCVIMATGYGKSLCYQYPSVFTGGTTFVISPLISLMEDQVLALSAANIKACFLGSAQTDQSAVIAGIKRKEYRVVYITPEFAEVAIDLLKEVHENIGIDLLAVDEAHCVSQWGHDFRSAYRGLGSLRTHLKDVPVLAVTATATPQVMVDICRSLKLKNPNYTCTGFDRPNLFMSVSMKSGDIMKDIRSQMSAPNGKLEFEGPTIVYCPTKKATEEVLHCIETDGSLAEAGTSHSMEVEEVDYDEEFEEGDMTLLGNHHTLKKTMQTIKRFQNWLWTDQYEDRPVESMPPASLNVYIGNFLRSLKRLDGGELEPGTLVSYHRAIDRHLRQAGYAYSIVSSPEFDSSRTLLEARIKEQKNKGLGQKPNRSQTLSDADVETLWTTGQLGRSDGRVLQHTMFFFLTQGFGLRGCQEIRKLEWGDVHLKRNANGEEYLEFMEMSPKDTKRNQLGNRTFAPKIFAIGGERCPVQLYKEFARRRPMRMLEPTAAFYLSVKPNHNPIENIWYTIQPMGKNMLGKIIPTMTKLAGLPGRYSTISLVKKTCESLLSSGVDPAIVCQLTGMKSVQSVRRYKPATLGVQKKMSRILTGGMKRRYYTFEDASSAGPSTSSSYEESMYDQPPAKRSEESALELIAQSESGLLWPSQ